MVQALIRKDVLRGISPLLFPLLEGAAALLLSLDKNLTPLELKSILLSTVVPSALLSTKVASGGSLHIGRAVAATTGAIAEQFPSGALRPL